MDLNQKAPTSFGIGSNWANKVTDVTAGAIDTAAKGINSVGRGIGNYLGTMKDDFGRIFSPQPTVRQPMVSQATGRPIVPPTAEEAAALEGIHPSQRAQMLELLRSTAGNK